MKRHNLLLAAAMIAALGISGCEGLGWSVSSGPYGMPDIGLSLSTGAVWGDPVIPLRPAPRPYHRPFPRPAPWGQQGPFGPSHGAIPSPPSPRPVPTPRPQPPIPDPNPGPAIRPGLGIAGPY